MNMFRELRADEIDCRISQVKKDGSGLSLLLYKDARCDQNILDEVVGPYKWKREHTRDNRNCIVSIWSDDLQQWISKEDTGTESNTEREKGLASDSFKRACFNWGIGRELYTAPFIWISKGDFTFKDGKCYDRFTVSGIGYTNGVISGLEIKNQKLNKIVFKYGKITEEAPVKPEQPDNEPDITVAPSDQLKPFTSPANMNVTVTTSDKVPPVRNEAEDFLKQSMKQIRETMGTSVAENNKWFKEHVDALIKLGLAPKKSLKEYSLDEAAKLIESLYQRFGGEIG